MFHLASVEPSELSAFISEQGAPGTVCQLCHVEKRQKSSVKTHQGFLVSRRDPVSEVGQYPISQNSPEKLPKTVSSRTLLGLGFL